MYYKEQLISIRESLSDLLSDLKKEKEALPEGSLYVDQKGGKNYYSHGLPKAGNRKKARRVPITKDPELVLALVRKKYVKTAIPIIEKDLEELDITIENYTPVSEASVMQSYCAKYPELTRGIFPCGSDPATWADEYEQPVFYTDDYKSVSAIFTLVDRGKSATDVTHDIDNTICFRT